jgi:hypothetical protein
MLIEMISMKGHCDAASAGNEEHITGNGEKAILDKGAKDFAKLLVS